MKENVEKFFALCESDPTVQQALDEAIANYPGSLEIRDALLEDTMLPLAASLGLEFTLKELRAYETKKKLYFEGPAAADGSDSPDRYDIPEYWLVDKGWSYEDPVKWKE